LSGLRRLALAVLLVFAGALVEVNAPSIWSGWGLVTVAMGVALLVLPPLQAGLAVLAGSLLALPFQAASKSVFLTVALAGIIVRPPLVAVSGLFARRAGRLAGLVLLGGLSGLATLSVAIVYYGENGIHASMAVYDVATLLLVYAAYRSAQQGTSQLLLAAALIAVYLLSTYAFSGPAAPLSVIGLLALLAGAWRERLRPHVSAAAAILLLAGLALSWESIVLNAKVLSYPLDPRSYSSDRWSYPGACPGSGSFVLRGVHDPGRLRVLEPCVTVTGRIAEIPYIADDGDYCIDLETGGAPLSQGNKVLLQGRLHAEIVPRDWGLLERAGGTLCRGDVVRVTGPLVVDTDHGQWVEVHPVVGLELVERGEGPCVSVGHG